MAFRRGTRRSKFNAVKTTVDGIVFASQKEARRYVELKLLEKAQQIAGLVCQMRYPLIVGEQFIASYVADFLYLDLKTARWVVEDVKGMKTPVYRLKKKLVAALYGIQIREV